MTFERSFATLVDDAEFASFRCCDEGNAAPWTEEAENYARVAALKRSEHCLAFRDAGELVAVSAFDRAELAWPIAQPVEHRIWRLNVVAVALGRQRAGLSTEVFRQTFEAMIELDATRKAVSAYVHESHIASLRACERVGLEPLKPHEDGYWLLLGPVPGP